MEPDWLTLGAVVAVGGLLWRALGTRIDDVGRRVDTLAGDVKTLDRRAARLEGSFEALASRVDALASDVKGVDRRVARLEGWLERDRADKGPGPDTP